eukprot:SM000037S13592  [mRNA]  locus=s37:709610:713144:- [translate_table: standard]
MTAGDNLEVTPWHPHSDRGVHWAELTPWSKFQRAQQALHCSSVCAFKLGDAARSLTHLSQPTAKREADGGGGGGDDNGGGGDEGDVVGSPACPAWFSQIQEDLAPWNASTGGRSGISRADVDAAQSWAAFRFVIVSGKLYVEHYYKCTQSRGLFTLWGIALLLRMFPLDVPDVDIMFDCMDRPHIAKSSAAELKDGLITGNGEEPAEEELQPLPLLFRYCSNNEHYDVPWPDWSFWGWPETNIDPWDIAKADIQGGARETAWQDRVPRAHWKGNPSVARVREDLMGYCKNSYRWPIDLVAQDWDVEVNKGYSNESALKSQCKHRYKIYAEGFAWSVSLKYILACGSTPLLISPEYYDFYSRGLKPSIHYLPVKYIPRKPRELCQAIKAHVDWGNRHRKEAELIGNMSRGFIEDLSMNLVYDYMLHLLKAYAALQTVRPKIPKGGARLCPDAILCYATKEQKKFLLATYQQRLPARKPCSLPS